MPVCVAAKNIDDGRYILANRAFERFSRFSRDQIVGNRADEIFRKETAASHRGGGPVGAAGDGEAITAANSWSSAVRRSACLPPTG